MDGRYSTNLRRIFVIFSPFIRPADSEAHTKQKIQKELPRKSTMFCVSFLYFYVGLTQGFGHFPGFSLFFHASFLYAFCLYFVSEYGCAAPRLLDLMDCSLSRNVSFDGR